MWQAKSKALKDKPGLSKILNQFNSTMSKTSMYLASCQDYTDSPFHERIVFVVI